MTDAHENDQSQPAPAKDTDEPATPKDSDDGGETPADSARPERFETETVEADRIFIERKAREHGRP